VAWRRGLRYGVGAAIEHDAFFRNRHFNTIVDVGGNRGQFVLVMKKNFPKAKVFSFEPLNKPFKKFNQLFANDNSVVAFNAAIGPTKGVAEIHVSARDDSSSLLPISDLQNEMFPGTSAVSKESIDTGPLSQFVKGSQIISPALLKLDVQGFELNALIGCNDLIHKFDMVYCECSFVELYVGQALAADIINYMNERSFVLRGFNNAAYDLQGNTVQADFVFVKSKI